MKMISNHTYKYNQNRNGLICPVRSFFLIIFLIGIVNVAHSSHTMNWNIVDIQQAASGTGGIDVNVTIGFCNGWCSGTTVTCCGGQHDVYIRITQVSGECATCPTGGVPSIIGPIDAGFVGPPYNANNPQLPVCPAVFGAANNLEIPFEFEGCPGEQYFVEVLAINRVTLNGCGGIGSIPNACTSGCNFSTFTNWLPAESPSSPGGVFTIPGAPLAPSLSLMPSTNALDIQCGNANGVIDIDYDVMTCRDIPGTSIDYEWTLTGNPGCFALAGLPTDPSPCTSSVSGDFAGTIQLTYPGYADMCGADAAPCGGPGTYPLTLELMATDRCTGLSSSEMISITVTVGPDPAECFDYSNVCTEDGTVLYPGPTQAVAGIFSITPSAAPIDPMTGNINVSAIPCGSAPINFTVTYTPDDAAACIATDMFTFIAPPCPPSPLGISDEICVGEAASVMVTCEPCADGSTVMVTWWNLTDGGTQQATGNPFSPTSGVSTSDEGVYNNMIPGTYTFYAQCECDGCSGERIPVQVIVFPELIVDGIGNFSAGCLPQHTGSFGFYSVADLFPNFDPNISDFELVQTESSTGAALEINSGAAGQAGSTVNVICPGCYEVMLEIADAEACIDDDADPFVSFIIGEQPEPIFSIMEKLCFSAGDPDMVLTPFIQSPDYKYSAGLTSVWTLTDPSGVSSAFSEMTGEITISNPPAGGSAMLTLNLKETITVPGCSGGGAVVETDLMCMADYTVQITVEDGSAKMVEFRSDNPNPCVGEEINLGAAEAGGTFTGTGVNDNGDGTGTFTPPSCGTFAISYTCSTSSGCTAVYVLNITTDQTPPTLTLPADTSVECGTENVAAWIDMAVANDNCNATISNRIQNIISGCGNTSTFIYEFTATDDCGNTTSELRSYGIMDETNPMVTSATDLTIECNPGTHTTLINDWIANNGGATATDGCGEISWSHDYRGTGSLILDCGVNTGRVQVGFTAMDECGNIAFSSAFIIIEDNTPPEIICPENIVLECGDPNNQAIINNWLKSPHVFDNCSFSLTKTNDFDPTIMDVCEGGLITTVTWTAEDACTNTATCSAEIIVQDTQAPVIIIEPKSTEVECDGAGNSGALMAWMAIQGGASAIDDCDEDVAWSSIVLAVPPPNAIPIPPHNHGTCETSEAIYVRFTVVDDCMNRSFADAYFIITDHSPPDLTAPAAASVECGSEDLDTWAMGAMIDDICDPTAAVTFEIFNTISACGGTIIQEVLFTGIDECGNEATAKSTYTILDTGMPTITCPPDITLECGDADNDQMILAFLNGATGDDSCSDFIITNSYPGSLPANCGGMTSVTFTITDGCENTNTCDATVTLDDTTDPSYINCPPANMVVNVDVDLCSANVIYSEPVAQDNCGFTSSRTIGPPSGTTFPEGDTPIEYTVTDECMNMAICDFVITVVDSDIPSIACPSNAVVVCADSGVCTWDSDDSVLPSTNENCATENISYTIAGGASMMGAIPNGTSFPLGDTEICYTVSDGANEASCCFVVTVEDCEPPALDCPMPVTVECDGAGNIAALDDWLGGINGGGGAVDECDGPISLTNSLLVTTNECGDGSTSVYTFTAIDGSGNSSSCTSSFTIEDTTPPMITSRAVTFSFECIGQEDVHEFIEWVEDNGLAEATDLCGEVSWSSDFTGSFAPPTCGNAGSVTVVFTATDDCGNSTNTEATFTITDNTPPEITCPENITLQCGDPANDAIIINWLASASAVDVCFPLVTIDEDFLALDMSDCAGTGTTTVMFTAADVCMNESNCTSDIIIIDNLAPEIVAFPSDMTVECDGAGNTAELTAWLMSNGGAIASDDCDPMPAWTNVPGAPIVICGNAVSTEYTFTITDDCGLSNSATATFIIEDNTGPTLTVLPAIVEVECDGAGNTTALNNWLTSAMATDICTNTPVVTNRIFNTISGCGGTMETVYEFIAADACGNQTRETSSFIVIDDAAPEIICPAALTISCGDANNEQIINAWANLASATDMCSDVSISNSYPGTLPANCGGSVTVTFTATDDCGNTDFCMIDITMTDDEDPVFINCPTSALIVNVDVDLCESNVIYSTPVAEDNCGVTVTRPVGPPSGTTFPLGDTPIQFLATDECMNTAICDFIITVVDSDIPSLSCPSNQVVVCNMLGTCAWTSDDQVSPSSIDNCMDAMITYTITGATDVPDGTGDAAGTVFNFGVSRVCYSIVDAAMNETMCCFNVVVEDCESPMITCPMPMAVECDGMGNTAVLQAWIDDAEASDNCDMGLVITSAVNNTLSGCGGGDVIEYVFSVSDIAGNISTCTSQYTIQDTTDPMIACPEELEINCEDPNAATTIQAWLSSVTSSDICSEVSISNDFPGIDNVNCGGMIPVTFTATDECGLSVSCTQNIIINDGVNPIISCPENIALECADPSNGASIANWLTSASAGDNCSGILMVTNDFDTAMPTDLCGDTGITTVTFTTEDNCGNMSECMATITIEDTTPPAIEIAAIDLELNCSGLNNTVLIDEWLMDNGGAEATDLCGAVTWSNMDGTPIMGCGATTTTPYVFTVTDECGNTMTTSAAVVTIDNTSPALTVPAELTVECGDPAAQTLTAWLATAMVTDDCGTAAITSVRNSISGCGGTMTEEYTFTAVDQCGNISTGVSRYIVQDIQNPTIIPPSTLALVCGDENNDQIILAWLGSATATDTNDCSEVTITHDYPNALPLLQCINEGANILITFTATDECGNEMSGTSMITRDDITPPTFVNCPTNLTVNVDVDLCESNVIFSTPTATDACNEFVTVTQSNPDNGDPIIFSGSTFPLGTTAIEFTASDGCNESICEFTITVIDSDIPSIDCPSNAVVVCTDIGACTWAGDDRIDPIGIDNCTGLNIDYEISEATIVAQMTGPTAAVETFNLGTSTVSYTVMDAAGLVSTCRFNVVVEDCDAPTITCNDQIDIDCSAVDLDTWFSDISMTAMDNCTGVITVDSLLLTDFSSCGSTFDRIYQYTVTDVAGNSSSCLARYETDDTTPPAITIAINESIQCDGSSQSAALIAWLSNNGGATFTSDDCSSPVTWTNNYTGTPESTCGSTVTVIFTATDECGNASSTTADFIVIDEVSPVLSCPADITLECGAAVNDAVISSWLSGASALDACDGIVAVTNDFATAMQVDDCGMAGMTTITFSTMDACENPTSCERIITIEDNSPPTIEIEAMDLIVNCSDDNTVAIEAWLLDNGGAVASDICAAFTWANAPGTPMMGCGANTTTPYIFTVTDECGNLTTTSAAVITVDNVAPVLTVPVEVTVECGDPEAQTLTAWLATAMATDDCGSASISNVRNTISGCGGTMTQEYTFTAMDQCGNTTTGVSNYIIVDRQNPTIIPPSELALVCGDENNDQIILAWLESAASTDVNDCSAVTITHDYPGGLPALLCLDAAANIVITFTATDECGNEMSGTSMITMDDITPPTFVNCPTNLTVNVDVDLCESNVIFSTPTATDACNEFVTVTQSTPDNNDPIITSGSTFPLGTTAIEFTAGDGCNESICEFTITVIDSDIPSIACPSNAVVVCTDIGDCSWAGDDRIDPIGIDNCTGLNIEYEISDATIVAQMTGPTAAVETFNLGTSTVTYTVTDAAGLVSTCSFDVVIEDCEAPTISCNDQVDIDCSSVDLNGWFTDISSTAMDNCMAAVTVDTLLLTDFSSCGGTFERVYQYTVTDAAGNSSSCLATYETDDSTPPVITQANNETIQCTGLNESSALLTWLNNNGGATFTSDDCSSPVTWTNNYAGTPESTCGSSVTVTFTATDECGNTSSTTADFIVIDKVSPVLSCPADITLECGAAVNDAVISSWLSGASAIDGCDGIVQVTNDFVTAMQVSVCGMAGVTTIRFSTMDACGNPTTCTRTITIEDNTPPTIEIEAMDLELNCSDDNTAMIAAWVLDNGGAVASDFCGGIAWTNMEGAELMGCGDNTIVTYVFTATDECKNSITTSAQIITIDNTSPTLTVPVEVTVECGDAAAQTLEEWLSTAVATDDCGTASISSVRNTISGCGGTMTQEYTFTALDQCGNVSTGISNYTIEDTQMPSITCPSALELVCGNGNNDQLILSWLKSATAEDANGCSEVTITHDYPNILPELLCINAAANIEITFTATDECGNELSCTSMITLMDDTAPEFDNCPENLTVNVDVDLCERNVIFSTPIATDACTDFVIVTQTAPNNGDPIIASGATFPIGTTAIEFTATDGCNESICEFTITVIDSDVPRIACPSNAVVVCTDLGTCTWEGDDRIDPIGLDNCPGLNILYEVEGVTTVAQMMGSTAAVETFILGTSEVTYTITDAAGLISTCSFDVVIEDCEAPSITCNDQINIDCGAVDLEGWYTGISATAMDNCMGALTVDTLLLTDFSSCGGTFERVYQYTVTDAAGNSSSCLATYETDDDTSPVITDAITEIVQCNGSSQSAALLAWLNNNGGATFTSDDCSGPVTWTNNYTGTPDSSCGSSVTVTFTATDDCGNTSITTADFTIIDDVAPLLTCPENITLECGSGVNEALISNWLSGSTSLDACDGVLDVTNDYSAVVQSDLCGATGITTVTFSTIDACMNPSNCIRTITIEDTTNPTIEIEASDLTLDCSDINNEALIEGWLLNNGGAIANDDCGSVSWTNEARAVMITCGNNTSTTYVFTVTDECGLTAVTIAEVITIDEMPPVINVPAGMTVECDGAGNIAQLNTWLMSVTGSDDCGMNPMISAELSNTISGCGSTDTKVFTFTAIDECGNITTGTSQFIIEDTTPPTPVCCPDYSISIPSIGFVNVSVLDIDCGSTDVCSNDDILVRTISKELFTIDDLGANVVTLTVTDECGLVSECMTTITVVQDPGIGIAKRAVEVVDNPDGSGLVTYEINVQNYGDVALTSLQVEDDLAMAFPAPCAASVVTITSDDFIINEGYNGTSDTELLEGIDILPIEEKGSINLTVLVDNCAGNTGPFENTATTSALDANGSTVSDISQDGSNPDPNNDGNPIEQEPTIVNFQSVRALGIAKNLVNSTLNSDGSFDLSYEFNIENFSNVVITDLQAVDDLAATFPAPCAIMVTSRTSSGFTVNDSYDGIGNNNLLIGNDDIEPGETGQILIEIRVESCGGNLGPFNNTAQVSGMTPEGALTDDSVDGTDPDPDGDNNPDEQSPTVVDFNANPVLGTSKRVSQGPLPNPDGTFDVVYEIRLENLGDVDLTLDQLNDDLALTYTGATSFELIGIESEEFAVNSDYDGVSDINLIQGNEILVPGEEAAVYVSVQVAPGSNVGPYFNSATAIGTSPLGLLVNDISQDGSEVDPDGNSDPSDNSDPTPVLFECIKAIVCPNVQDTITQANDPGWCQAVVNFPLAEARPCAGLDEPVFQYLLEGVGADGVDIDTWIEGQPSGLEYLVGVTKVNIRYFIDGMEDMGYSDTCMLHVNVLDKEKPILTAGLPVDMILSCEEVLDTFIMTPSQVQDNCGEPTIEFEIISSRILDPADCGFYSYIDTLRWTLDDGSQNSCAFDQVVTYIDETPPMIILPPDTTITECQVIENFVCRDSIFSIGEVDTTVLINDQWVLTTIVLKDTIELCDTVLMQAIDPSLGASFASAEDNCAPLENIMITFSDSLDIVCKGDKAAVIYRTWYAEDPCGNIDSAIQILEVLDKNPPELTCKDIAEVSLETDGTVTLQPSDVVNSLFDACFSYTGSSTSNIDVQISPSLFNCNDLGEHAVLIAAVDPCNNRTSYCEVKVVIIDNVAPVLTCPSGPITLDIANGDCRSIAPELNELLDLSDCSVDISTEPELFDGLTIGTHDITITATDASGNSSTCVATFIVTGEPVDFSSALACNDTLNISLNGECQLILSADYLIENDGALCTDLLCIEIEGETGDVHENFFDESDINQLFKAKVIDCNGSQNSCWTVIRIEEKQKPQIEWPADAEVLCIEPTDPEYYKVGTPIVLNCEDDIDMTYVDLYKEFERCLDIRASIERTWTVSDDEGNTEDYLQLINILPFALEHVTFPEDISILKPIDCNALAEDDLTLSPDSTGRPSIFSLPLDQNGGLCLFSMLYEDRVFNICEGSFEVLRTWFVRDVCGEVVPQFNPLEHVQVITVFDFDAPDFITCQDSASISINPWQCVYTGPLAIPESLSDNCSSITVEAYVTGGGYVEVTGSLADGDLSIQAFDLIQGVHEITYVAKDDCRNVSLCQYKLDVIDNVAPVLVCQDTINISLTGSPSSEPTTKLFVKDIELGSVENRDCNPTTLTVIRKENYDAGQVILNDGSKLKIQGRYGYHYVTGCEPDGEVRDTTFTKEGEVESVNVIPFALEKDFVKFCCTDVGIVEVVMIARDIYENVNFCSVPVNVENKLGFALVCEDYTVACTDEIAEDRRPSIGGLYCNGGDYALDYFDSGFNNTSGCADGEVIRTWYLDVDADGELTTADQWCEQTISFDDSLSSFDPLTIKWPVHLIDGVESGLTLECDSAGDITEWPTDDIALAGSITCDEAYDPVIPVWCELTCGLVGSSFEIDTVTTNSACLKLVKKWTVIDWCTYEANESNEAAGDLVELIKDDTNGVCLECPDRNGASSEAAVFYRYTDKLRMDGYYRYDQIIEIKDDTAPVMTVSDTLIIVADDDSCTASSSIEASAQDFCGDAATGSSNIRWRAILTTVSGEMIYDKSENGASMTVDVSGPIGEELLLTWEAADNCGNAATARTVIYLKDNIAPSVICISGVSIALNAEGQTAIWAKDFNASSFDNCTVAEDLVYTIVKEGTEPLHPGEAGFSDQSNAVINCDELQESVSIGYDVWVWDQSDNGNSCTVSLLASELCDPENISTTGFASISGQVTTADAKLMANVEVTVGSSLAEYPKSILTNEGGIYSFIQNPTAINYNVDAAYEDDYANGLSTLDLLLIQNHVLNIKLFDSPYSTIAADANVSSSVSAADIIALQKIILGINDRLSQSEAWRFVVEDQAFLSANDPWPYLDEIEIIALSNDMTNQNLIGVKVGDVNQSVNVPGYTNTEIRATGKITIHTTDKYLKKGETVDVIFKSDELTQVRGFQTTFIFNGIRFEDVFGAHADVSKNDIALHEDQLAVSWITDQELNTSAQLFSIRVIAERDLWLSEALSMSSDYLTSEVYVTSELSVKDLELEFDNEEMDETAINEYKLFQNQPNPFVDYTVIGFNAPQIDMIDIIIYDVSGMEIKRVSGEYQKGYHEVRINKQDLNGAGMFYYKLESETYHAMSRMILLN